MCSDMEEKKGSEKRRVPRADKLNLIRDILHLLEKLGGYSTVSWLMKITETQFTPSKAESWDFATFGEYVNFLRG